jgi:hypothetical protein
MSELVIEPFTNEFGQVINPGDEVIYAGTSWKNTTIRKGVFAGVRYDNVIKYRRIVDADGNPVMETDRWGVTRQKTEYYTERAIVAVRVDKVNRGHKYGYVTDPLTKKRVYKKLEEVRYSSATLPYKRVYKLDTPLASLVGNSM